MSQVIVLTAEQVENLINSTYQKAVEETERILMDRFISVSEAAYILGETPKNIYTRIKSGEIKNVRSGDGKITTVLRSEILKIK